MNKVTANDIIDNLNKWKNICELMKSKRDIAIIDEIIKKINECNNEKIISDKLDKKETDTDKLKKILNAIKEENEFTLNEYKLSVIKLNVNLQEEWDKLSESKKLKLSKLELNVIYSMLYRPVEVTYINKTKKQIIKDINYFIKDEKRDKSLQESNLI